MFLSLLNIQSSNILNSLSKYDYEKNLDGLDLSSKRPPLRTRRVICLLLARYLSVKADLLSEEQTRLVEIKRHPSGEPYLEHPDYPEDSLPAISISHSGPWMACLLADQDRISIGIDIEDTTILRSYKKVSEHVFSKGENQFVEQFGKIGFYKLWTAKEALAKCQKSGLSQTLKIDLGRQLETPIKVFSDASVYSVSIGGDVYILYQNILNNQLFWCIAQNGDEETMNPKLFFL